MKSGKPRLAVLAYCFVNLLFFVTLEPYHPIGDGLLLNGDFTRGMQGWTIRGKRDGVSVESGALTIDHPGSASTKLSQCWPKAELPQPLLLSAESRGFGVVQGAKPWHQARVDLVGYDAQGRGIYRVKTRLLGLRGDRPWHAARALYRIPEKAQRVCLEIALYNAPGRFQVRRLTLFQGEEAWYYRIARLLLLTGWGLLAIWLAYLTHSHYRHSALGRWLLAAAFLLLVGVLLPHGLLLSMDLAILDALKRIGITLTSDATLFTGSPWRLWPELWGLSKYAHLAGFALISILLFTDRSLPWRRLVATLILLALATEILQFFVPMRTPRLSDGMVDLLGIAIGFGISGLGLLIRKLIILHGGRSE